MDYTPDSKSDFPKSGTGKWVVVQLSNSGEHEKNMSTLERSVHRILRTSLSVFIPAANQKARGDVNVQFIMDGYIFVEYRSDIQYQRLSGTTYFDYILTSGQKQLHLVTDKEILPIKKGVENLRKSLLSVGDNIKVTKGSFKNLVGVVSSVYEDGESVQISVGLVSKPLLIDYPASYLVKL